VEEVKEQVTVTEEITKLGKPKKTTKKKIIKRRGKEQQVTEVVTVEEEGKAPETTVTEGPLEEIVEETIKPLPALEKVKPTEIEEVKEQVTVTEEITKLGKPKKTTKKKIIKRRGKEQQVTEVVTVEEEGKTPQTTVTEGPLEEIVEETIKPLPSLERVEPTEVEEVKELVTVTEEITKLGKPKKTTKKKIIKRRGKEQQVTEVVTVEEEGKAPETTVTEGPLEEIVEETIKPLPVLERVEPTEVEEVKEQVTVTDEITKLGKPKKTTKKKIIKRRGKEQQVTEVVTVEEEGKAPETTVTEGPLEEIVEETIKPLPALEKVQPTEVEEVKE
ncbi:titin-like, partial [Apis laboriosa]|uniref:titin-like n=1 Tax=Apis laboriosa TaxID=183418 RepID=UPI001CC47ADA